MRHISFSLTEAQFLAGTKDVTRRLGWRTVTPGTQLMAARKCMGLKKGEKVHTLGVIKVLTVRREPLRRLIDDPAYGRREVWREGFPDLTPEEFVAFFCRSHPGCTPDAIVTRINFRKVKI